MKRLLMLIAAVIISFTLTACVPQEVICTFPDQEPVDLQVQVDMEEINAAQGRLIAKETKARLLLEEYYEQLEEYELSIVICEETEAITDCHLVDINLEILNNMAIDFNDYMIKNAGVWEYVKKPEDLNVILEIIEIETEE